MHKPTNGPVMGSATPSTGKSGGMPNLGFSNKHGTKGSAGWKGRKFCASNKDRSGS